MTQVRREKIITGKIFSQVSMHVAFLPLSILGTVSFLTIGSCIILNYVLLIKYGEVHEVNIGIIFTFKSEMTYGVYTYPTPGSRYYQLSIGA
jgi:hypothetical protein